MFGFRDRFRFSSQDEPVPSATGAVSGVVEPGPGGSSPRDLDGRTVLARFAEVLTRVPRYLRLGRLLMNDRTVSARGKVALAGALAYAISPIDPIPGFIPVIGQLDDLALLLLGIRAALKSAPTEVVERHLQEAGLSWEILERDLIALRATAIWLARRTGKLAAKAGRALFTVAAGKLREALPGRATGNGASEGGA